MELPDVAKVERLGLRPGDRLVLTVDHMLQDDEYSQLASLMKKWTHGLGLPENGVLILEPGASLQVLEASP